jgi:hypothetical protein
VSTLVDITFNTFHKFTATFRTQICRKCLRIQLNGFRSVQTLVDITSNIIYKCTATFRTHFINFPHNFFTASLVVTIVVCSNNIRKLATTASFFIISSSSFSKHLVIRCYRPWTNDCVIGTNNKQISTVMQNRTLTKLTVQFCAKSYVPFTEPQQNHIQ